MPAAHFGTAIKKNAAGRAHGWRMESDSEAIRDGACARGTGVDLAGSPPGLQAFFKSAAPTFRPSRWIEVAAEILKVPVVFAVCTEIELAETAVIPPPGAWTFTALGCLF